MRLGEHEMMLQAASWTLGVRKSVSQRVLLYSLVGSVRSASPDCQSPLLLKLQAGSKELKEGIENEGTWIPAKGLSIQYRASSLPAVVPAKCWLHALCDAVH